MSASDEITETSQTVAGREFRSFIERIERLEEERKTIADDIAEVFKELKGRGFDKEAAKVVLKIRRSEGGMAAYDEHSTIVDLYLAAMNMIPAEPEARAPARTRENIDEFRPVGSPEQVATSLPPHDADGIVLEDQEVLSQSRIVNPAQEPTDYAEQLGDESSARNSPSAATPPEQPNAPEAIRPPEASGAAFSIEVSVTRSATPGADGDQRSIPSPDAGGAKMAEVLPQPERAAVKAGSHSAKSGQVANQSFDEDVPAFVRNPKEGCLDRAGCKTKSTSVLCSRCANERAKARAAA
ncbi:MAG: DUF2312 domain-containing protein [Proteobacteria bacterium]|nr:DUF2312 domain-containing protein [Pseudomonadota bacterium]